MTGRPKFIVRHSTSVAQFSPHHGPPAGLGVDGGGRGGRRPRRTPARQPSRPSPDRPHRPDSPHQEHPSPEAPRRSPREPRPAAATQPMTPPQPELQHRPKSPRTCPKTSAAGWSTRSGWKTTHMDAAPRQHDFPGPSPCAGGAASPATPAATAGPPWCSSARAVERWG
jgi:hypothetical protein